jgi:hypothetical protein
MSVCLRIVGGYEFYPLTVSLASGLREDMSLAGSARIQGSLGNNEMEDGL